MKRKEYRIETIINGVCGSSWCNNYNCACAYCEKVERENVNTKTAIYDDNGKLLYLNDNRGEKW